MLDRARLGSYRAWWGRIGRGGGLIERGGAGSVVSAGVMGVQEIAVPGNLFDVSFGKICFYFDTNKPQLKVLPHFWHHLAVIAFVFTETFHTWNYFKFKIGHTANTCLLFSVFKYFTLSLRQCRTRSALLNTGPSAGRAPLCGG